jgi:hypothetical protein
VQVVEDQHEWLLGRQQREQLAHGAVAAVALVDARVLRRRERRERGKHGRELRDHVARERRDATRIEAAHVLVERVDEDPEGHVDLELGCASGQHEVAAGISALRQLGEQARLADPGLADQLEHDGTMLVERVERVSDRAELVRATDQTFASERHTRIPPGEHT